MIILLVLLLILCLYSVVKRRKVYKYLTLLIITMLNRKKIIFNNEHDITKYFSEESTIKKHMKMGKKLYKALRHTDSALASLIVCSFYDVMKHNINNNSNGLFDAINEWYRKNASIEREGNELNNKEARLNYIG